MEGILTPQFLIPLLIAIVIFAVWFYFDKHKNKNQKDMEVKKGEIVYDPIEAVVFDRTSIPYRVHENVKIPASEVKEIVENKELGSQSTFMGKRVFTFFKIFDDNLIPKYKAVVEPTDMKHPPQALFIDIQHPYVSILDDMREDKNFIQKYGHLLIWLGVIAFLIVLVITNKP